MASTTESTMKLGPFPIADWDKLFPVTPISWDTNSTKQGEVLCNAIEDYMTRYPDKLRYFVQYTLRECYDDGKSPEVETEARTTIPASISWLHGQFLAVNGRVPALEERDSMWNDLMFVTIAPKWKPESTHFVFVLTFDSVLRMQKYANWTLEKLHETKKLHEIVTKKQEEYKQQQETAKKKETEEAQKKQSEEVAQKKQELEATKQKSAEDRLQAYIASGNYASTDLTKIFYKKPDGKGIVLQCSLGGQNDVERVVYVPNSPEFVRICALRFDPDTKFEIGDSLFWKPLAKYENLAGTYFLLPEAQKAKIQSSTVNISIETATALERLDAIIASKNPALLLTQQEPERPEDTVMETDAKTGNILVKRMARFDLHGTLCGEERAVLLPHSRHFLSWTSLNFGSEASSWRDSQQQLPEHASRHAKRTSEGIYFLLPARASSLGLMLTICYKELYFRQ